MVYKADEWIPFLSSEAMEKAWKQHQKELMTMPFRGIRPWAWWEYESFEPKKQISGPAPLAENYLDRGEPALWQNKQDADLAVFEAEYEYLKRLNLLLPGEAEEIENDRSKN